MLRAIVHKKNATIFVIIVCLLAALATIWPMRLYKENRTFSTGADPVMTSDPVTEEMDAGEYFIAQYDHLQTLEFYVDSVIRSGRAHFQLFHVRGDQGLELTAEEEIDLPAEVPGFASVSVDADLVPGELYVYTVRGEDRSSFTLAFESQGAAEESESAPLYQVGFYNDTGIEDAAVKTRLVYRINLTKGPSAVLALLYVGAAILASVIVSLWYRKHPEKDRLLTVLRVMQSVLTPVVIVVFGIAFIAAGPLHLFDRRPLDILIYEIGVILSAFLCLYGLWHDRSGEPDLINGELFSRNLWHYGIIICIALIMNFSADYMNAVNDRIHDAATARIAAMLFLIVIFMGDTASNFNVWTAVVTVVSIVLSVIRASLNHVSLPDAAGEADPAAGIAGAGADGAASLTAEQVRQLNAVTDSRAFAAVLGAIAVTSLIVMLVDRIRRKKHPQTSIRKWILIPVIVFSVMLFIFRNTRTWIPLMLAVWIIFYLRYRYWEGRGRFLQDLCEGILLDFIFKVAYSMLHRYYMAYLYSRFSMHFHTPTVTAYYLCIVGAAAITLYLLRLKEALEKTWEMESAGAGSGNNPQTGVSGAELSPDSAVKEWKKARREIILAHTWKEAFLLGLAGSYMAMSLSRAGLGVLFVLLVIGSIWLAGTAGIPGTRPVTSGAETDHGGNAGAPAGDNKVAALHAGMKTGAPTESSEPAASDEDAAGAGVSSGNRRNRSGFRMRTGLLSLLASLLIIVVTFPIAFTGQRLISTVYAHPERFEELEPYDDRLLRNVTWNNTRFMNIEIFIRDFGDRILGGEIGSKIYYGNDWNIPQGYRTSMLPEDQLLSCAEGGLVASEGDAAVPDAMAEGSQESAGDTPSDAISEDNPEASDGVTEDNPEASDGDIADNPDAAEDVHDVGGSLNTGDASNGRMALYQTYIDHLNMTGHDEMGVELPTGEVAWHAHNILLQTAYDCGIPTGIVFAAVLILLFIGALRFAVKEGKSAASWKTEGNPDSTEQLTGVGRNPGKTDTAAKMPPEGNRFALLPLLLVTGFILVGMVEWIFHFSNPYTLAVLFAVAPILFPEKKRA